MEGSLGGMMGRKGEVSGGREVKVLSLPPFQRSIAKRRSGGAEDDPSVSG